MTMAMTVMSVAGWTPGLAVSMLIETAALVAVCGGYALWVTGRFAGRFALATVRGVQHGNDVMRRAKSINRIRMARALAIAVIVALTLAASASSVSAASFNCDYAWWTLECWLT